MKHWIRQLLPHGLIELAQTAFELERLGLPRSRARQLALRPGTAARLKRLNFDLLPDGALREMSTVIDAGANAGHWTADLLQLCQPERIACIEPDPTLAQGLRRQFAGRAGVEIHELALGAAAGSAELKIMHDPVFNSLRHPSAGLAAMYQRELSEPVQTITVSVKPLDELTRETARISLLKIDVQGFEREVLAGAVATLQKTDHVLVEILFQPHYEGQAGFFELDQILQRHGFRLCNYSEPVSSQRQALYADALYVRPQP